MMEWSLIWSARATRELQTVRKYIAADNQTAADRLVRQILERMEGVRQVPTVGSPHRDQTGREYRQIVVGKYRIIFDVNLEQRRVEVLTVWHGSRREPDLE